MVVDHVEDHFDAGGVEALHHRLEFGDLVAGQETRLRREEAERLVTPVIAEVLFDEIAIIDEILDGKNFHRGDAELGQMLDDRIAAHAEEGAAQLIRHMRMRHGHAAHMRLIDDRIVPGAANGLVAIPVEAGSCTTPLTM